MVMINNHGILADAMGLGKTVMTIALILANPSRGRWDDAGSAVESVRHSKMRSNEAGTQTDTAAKVNGGTLIVCPMALLGQWKDELEAHSEPGSISVFVHYGGDRTTDPKEIAKYHVVLTTYGVLAGAYKGDWEKDSIFHRISWYRVVLDEAHTIKSSKARVSQSAFLLTSHCRWCLTGTPLQNHLEDLYSLLCFLHVEPWCNWEWWHKLIQRPYENGDERGLRLVRAILRPLMLRRTKDTKDKDGRPILVLPPANVQIVECEQSEAERDFYEALFRKSKIAGAAAAAGLSLADVAAEAKHAFEHVGTMGVALSVCTLPGEMTSDRLGPGLMELGLGIHGEPGAAITDLQPVDAVVSHVLN